MILERWTTPKMIGGSLGLVILFLLLFQGILIPRFSQLTGGGTILDMQILYSPQEAYASIDNYGEAGRAFYTYIQITDMLFPLAYVWSLAILIHAVGRRAFPAISLWRYCPLLPVLAGVSDYIENVGIFLMLRRYPDPFPGIAWATSLCGALKFSLLGLSVACIILGVGRISINAATETL
ncbi:hypothetical protein GF339_13845 [candidate division KSB3 bacterium]|uniref:Uncharacterized protein n=1 Tax=candidate division KSB3 bacterium TaxID=2044937 RepID=A0A9D5Q6S3_9BACT|nr:hypothetical protein [candidate division KSB3 bacterium]MBD3325663.1 hypothetical protein [candidate division KSB3 bacterium]